MTKPELIKEINSFKAETIKLLDIYEQKTKMPWKDEMGYTKKNMPLVFLDKSCMRLDKVTLEENHTAFKELLMSVKKAVDSISENYQTINMNEYLEEKAARDKVAEIQARRGDSTMQDVRRYNDATAGLFLGVQEINTNNTGWDGRYNGVIPFENKGNRIWQKHNLNGVYQDTSDAKLNKLYQGGLACNTSYIADGWISYMVVYNTGMIVDVLKNNRNNPRKTGVVSLEQILDAGGKIVANMFSVNETYADIIRRYPRLKKRLTVDDIVPASKAKSIAKKMAYWV